MPTVNERMHSLASIAEMQDSLNKIINKQWRNIGNEKALTPFHYATEIAVEAVELIDDSGVEHTWWKNVGSEKFDEFNVKIEIIDMLHFYVSQMILIETARKGNKFAIPDEWKEMYMGADVSSMFAQGVDLESFDRLLEDTNKLNHEHFVKMLHEMISLYKYENPEVPDAIFYRMGYGIFHTFLTLARIDCQEMSAIFQAKMELNRFRQSEGYKSGKYIKVKDGIEDNQRLEPIVQEFLDDKDKTLGWVAKKVRDTFFQLTV